MTMEQERIDRCLEKIRPFLKADGGDVIFKRFRPDGVVELQWVGTCRVCPMSLMTLRAGVERVIMHEIPEVKRVEAVSA